MTHSCLKKYLSSKDKVYFLLTESVAGDWIRDIGEGEGDPWLYLLFFFF
jgi:hypothetical protein